MCFVGRGEANRTFCDHGVNSADYEDSGDDYVVLSADFKDRADQGRHGTGSKSWSARIENRRTLFGSWYLYMWGLLHVEKWSYLRAYKN